MNWGIEVLQTFALPLGYGAISLCLTIITKHLAFVKSILAIIEKVLFLLPFLAIYDKIFALEVLIWKKKHT